MRAKWLAPPFVAHLTGSSLQQRRTRCWRLSRRVRVPTTITRITASMTAYSATSCPRSSSHAVRRTSTMSPPPEISECQKPLASGRLQFDRLGSYPGPQMRYATKVQTIPAWAPPSGALSEWIQALLLAGKSSLPKCTSCQHRLAQIASVVESRSNVARFRTDDFTPKHCNSLNRHTRCDMPSVITGSKKVCKSEHIS